METTTVWTVGQRPQRRWAEAIATIGYHYGRLMVAILTATIPTWR